MLLSGFCNVSRVFLVLFNRLAHQEALIVIVTIIIMVILLIIALLRCCLALCFLSAAERPFRARSAAERARDRFSSNFDAVWTYTSIG